MAESLAEVVVESVRVHMLSSQHVVLLKETDRERYLPIWIGPWEANAIAARLQGVTSERPLTHDLFATTLGALGVELRRVIVSSLTEETFHATLELERDGQTYAIDARPSDALALAVRTGVRIYASIEVLDRAGVEPDSQVEERLEVFREFVNSLGLDLDEEHRRRARLGPRPPRQYIRSLARPAAGPRPGQPRIGSPRRMPSPRPNHSRNRSDQKSRTARKTTEGLAPVGEPAVRG